MNNLIITTNELKNKLIKQNNKLENNKYITFKELKENIYFKYDIEALYEVMKKENVSYEMGNIYLTNLYYLEGNTKKINKLKEIHTYLNEAKLLKYNPLFKNYIKKSKVTLHGIEYLTKEEEKLLKNIPYEKVKLPTYNKKVDLYIANTIEEEIIALATNIVKLIKNNVKEEKIYIINLNDEYKMLIEKIFSWYNINTSITIAKQISSTKLIRLFLNEDTITDGINKIKEEIKTIEEQEIYEKIIQISKNYITLPNDEITKQILTEELNKITIKNEYGVKEGTIDNIYNEDEYVFIIGFNEGILPKIYKDEDYLNDLEKQGVGINTTTDNNIYEKNKLIYLINHTKNITLSYKNKTTKETFFPSSLLEELNINYKEIDNDYTISNLSNKIKLATMLDEQYKYNITNKDLKILYSTYPNINYDTYTNKFSGISQNNINKLLTNNITLSYSTINNFNKCSFRYYLENILKISEYEETFMTYIGKMYHYILSLSFNNNFNFETSYNNFIKENKKSLTNKEKYFLFKLKKELKFIIEEIKKQNTLTTFNETLYEEEIKVLLEDNFIFKGIIDKIMYNEKEKILSIIDYKTGTTNLDLSYLNYGIDIQLPIYLYLIEKYDKLKNYKIVGFYLQRIINKVPLYNEKKSYIKQKQEDLKLQGYTLASPELIKKFDSSYENSEIIKSMKMTNNGFGNYSKVLNDYEITKIIEIVDENIKTNITKIKNGEFTIDPKKTYQANLGCEHCEYESICYHTEKDFINIEKAKLEDVLGGNINA